MLSAAAILLIAAAVSLSAQVAVTLEGGATRTNADVGAPLSSTALGATLSVLRPWASAGAAFSWLRFADSTGTTALQGTAGASAFTAPLASGIRAEAALSGSLLGVSDSWTGRLAPVVRLHALGTAIGGWVGAGYGVGKDADSARGIATAEAAAWIRRDGVSLSLLAVPTRVGPDLSYVEGSLAGRLERPSLDLFVALGARSTARTPAQTWLSASLTAWLTSGVAVLASGGRFPDDPIQGFGGGRFVSVGVRVATRRPDRMVLPTRGTPLDQLPRRPSGPIALRVVTTEQDAVRELIVTAPGARQVDVQGELTGWVPLPLRQLPDGRWVLRLRLAPGPQRLVVRLDGGPWIVPAGTTRLEDEFGSESGLIVIP